MHETPKTPFYRPQRWTRLRYFLRDDQGVHYFIIAVVALIVSGIGLLVWAISNPVIYEGNDSRVIQKPEPVYYSPLTGVKVDEVTAKRQVTAVMIENSLDARPQSGLKEAGVVFEAVAEGGITRFVSLYQEAQPKLVGPVRSLRPYYVEWAAAFDPSVAHVGGSHNSLKMIRSGKYGHDIDQFFNPGAYWRSNDRYAPHNVYTNFKRLNALNKSKGYSGSSFTGFPRQDEEKAKRPTATKINMDVSSGDYAVSYAYDNKSNSYIRSQGGKKHKDQEKGQISPKIAIAIKVNMKRGFEDGYREQITTQGSGEAFIFQNGIVVKGKWVKKAPKSQIVFIDRDGNEIKLNRGQTWITAVPKDRSVSWR